MGLKQPGREGDLSHSPRAKVRNGWIYSSTLVYAVTACIGKIQITRFYSTTGHLLPHFASTALRSLVSRFGSYFRYHHLNNLCFAHTVHVWLLGRTVVISYTTETQNKHGERGKTHYNYYYYGGGLEGEANYTA